MPSPSTKLRDRMTEMFGSIDPGGPLEFLSDRGWKEHEGHLTPPHRRVLTDVELEVVRFLRDEWYFYVGALP